MSIEKESFQTSDIALASYLYASGIPVVSINRSNPRHCIFILKNPQAELFTQWQQGTAKVNPLAFYNAFQFLKRMVHREIENEDNS